MSRCEAGVLPGTHPPAYGARAPLNLIDSAFAADVNLRRQLDFQGEAMIAGLCRIAAALAMAGLPVVAVAQAIPPSDQPGRERERFTEPTAPRARPTGATISLPSTVAPAGAENTKLAIRSVRVTGSTV